jgi:hypothetical protein
MAYVTSIIPEVLAYPFYALSSYAIVRALASRSRAWIAAAVACSIVALLVRNQLMTIGGSLALAALILLAIGPASQRLRARWTRGDHLGAIVLLVGVLILANRVVGNHVQQWQVSTEFWKGRMVDYGLTAGGALTIGLGIAPVIGGLSSLWLRDRRADPVYRAFAAYLAASIVTLGLYTAVKATYLSTIFAQLTEERNLIYLSPLLLIGTALCFESRRVSPWVVAAASAFALYIVIAKPYQLGYPYFEAPGYGILTMANRHWYFNTHDLHVSLTIAWAVATAALLAPILLARSRDRFLRPLLAVGAVALAAWMLAGEITSSAGDDAQARMLSAHLPQPRNWVDLATHGGGVTYLGQAVKDANGIWLTEFWNRSLKHVYTLDGTAPGPGPSVSPDLLTADGKLSDDPGTPYVLADHGVDLDAPLVGHRGELRLYRVHGPWRLRQAVQAIYPDGWAGEFAGFTFFKRGGAGVVHVSLSRTAYCGGARAGIAQIWVGPVKIDANQQASFARIAARRRVQIENCKESSVDIRVPSTPVRAEVHISRTLPPTKYDQRHLGAMVSFSFDRARR